MTRRNLPLSKVYQLLEPGPVVLLTTRRGDRANIMTLSWLTMMEFEPPLVGCVISNRNYSFDTIKKTRECVINLPSVDLAEKVVACGNSSGSEINKFETFGLTAKSARYVAAPLIDECFANLECKVVDTGWVNKYCLFVLEVIQAWKDPAIKNPQTIHHQGKGHFIVDGEHLKLK